MLSRPVIGPITSRYGWRTINGAPNFHNGLDYGWLNADGGTKSKDIYAPASGVVSVGWNDLIGNFVSLAIDPNHVVRLCHFDSVAVKSGQSVRRGQFLGRMGATGSQAIGAHLHMDMYVQSVRVDPEPYVTEPFYSFSSTLPTEPIVPEEFIVKIIRNGTTGREYLVNPFVVVHHLDAGESANAQLAVGGKQEYNQTGFDAAIKAFGFSPLSVANMPAGDYLYFGATNQHTTDRAEEIKAHVSLSDENAATAILNAIADLSPAGFDQAALVTAIETALADNFARIATDVNNDLKARL